jgi:hypothetical protein
MSNAQLMKMKDTQAINSQFKPMKWAVDSGFIDRWPFQKRQTQLWIEGMKWYPRWQDQARYLNPTRGFFYYGIPDYGPPLDHGTLIDSHVRRCIRDFACGMQSGMTSPARPWFELEVQDKDLMKYGPVKNYFEICNKRLLDIAGHSNIYDGFYNSYEELATFGTAAWGIVEDENDVFRAENFTIGEYFLGCGPDGRVNAFTRSTWKTVSQIVEEYGEEMCSPTVISMYYNNQSDAWRRVIQLVEINDDRIPDYDDFAHKHTRSITWEDGSQQNLYLKLEGFNEFPLICPRWQPRTTHDNYGNGPGADFLGDVRMLQMMQKKKLIGLDKVVDPPLQADSSVGNVTTLPGAVTRFSASTPNAGVKPLYQVQIDLAAIREDIMEIKEAANQAFFTDLFKTMINDDRPGITAYEIAEKKAEIMNMLSPIVNSLNNSQNNMAVLRMYNIARRTGQLPPMPKELRGNALQVKYISILTQAQRMMKLQSIQETLGFFAQNAQVFPQMIDNIDQDNISRGYMEDIGLPASYFADLGAIKKKRDAQAKAQQEQQKQQAALVQAKVAADAGKGAQAAGSAPLGQGTALDALLSGMGGGGGQPGQ